MGFYKKRGQMHSRVFMYILAVIIAAFLLLFGYKMISSAKEKACETRLVILENDLKESIKSISARVGSVSDETYDVPCGIKKIYFVDLDKGLASSTFSKYPLMEDMIEGGVKENVFLIKSSDAEESFYVGDLEIEYPHYKCFSIKNEKLELFLEGYGASTNVRHKDDYSDCAENLPVSIIPIPGGSTPPSSKATRIIHTPVTETGISSPIDIVANIEYAGTSPQVLIMYKKDDGNWESALMALDSGTNEKGVWKVQVPAYDEND